MKLRVQFNAYPLEVLVRDGMKKGQAMVLYVRAQNQNGRVWELVCDGESQPLPNLGDHITYSDFEAEVRERTFHYQEAGVLRVLLKVYETQGTYE